MATLNGKLDVYDKILSKQKYLAGDVRCIDCSDFGRELIWFFFQEITLADLYHIALGSGLSKTGVNPLEDEKRPNVVRYFTLSSRNQSQD